MKKLMVCGCSFSATSTIEEYKGTSWSEVLADKLGWELQNVARQGCSNGGIRIQIDEVIRQRPDFAIITPTSYDRIEIPNFHKEKISITNFNPFQPIVDLFLRPTDYEVYQDDKKSYFKEAGLDNINYGNNRSRLIIETMHSLCGDWGHAYRPNMPVPQEVQEALKMHLNHLYDARWKRQTDEWIIRDGLVQLRANNIPFLVNPGFSMWHRVDGMKNSLANVIDEKYMLDDDGKNPFSIMERYPPEGASRETGFSGPTDPGYHTSTTGQKIIAEHFFNIIKNRWGL